MGQRRQLEGMRVLVTGASQGIGRAIATVAAQRGARVLASARSLNLLQELAESVRKTGGTISIVEADVSNPEGRQKMLQAAVQHFGGLDILINNAGIGACGPFADVSPEAFRQLFETNFFAAAELIRLCLPVLRSGNKPAIVNISSILGKRAMPGQGIYSASKFAIQGLSESLRAELITEGIDVLIVNPGATETNFHNNIIEDKGRPLMSTKRRMSALAVGHATIKAIEKGRNETNLTIAGKTWVLLSRLLPWSLDFFTRRRSRKQAAKAKVEK
jgi:short-subunit dehydrogenase